MHDMCQRLVHCNKLKVVILQDVQDAHINVLEDTLITRLHGDTNLNVGPSIKCSL
jgi:hypothetical protein